MSAADEPPSISAEVALLLEWFREDDIIDTQTADWFDIERMGERYKQLLALGIDPYA